MSENNYSHQFGVHSVTIHDINNGYKPFENGFLPIIGGLTLTTTQESVDLLGGSNLGVWASENGQRSDEISLTMRQLEPAAMTEFAGAVLTEIAASATGSITNQLVNTKGTSVLNATTGVASVGIKSGSEADLKAGIYFVVATGATTVTLYCATNIDFDTNGAIASFDDGSCEIIATDLTIASGAAVEVPKFGLELTGGSGVIALTSGDVASFSVAPAHGGVLSYAIGKNGSYPSYVGLTCYGQKASDGSHFEIRFPKVKMNGIPIAFTEKAFGDYELTGKLITAQDWLTGERGVYFMRQIKGI